MSKDNPVPKLDLAPKLKRPLSLWNPLDYLHLLYWVFYFPQALRWYIDQFGGDYIPEDAMSWRQGWQILCQNSVQRSLLFQGTLLTIIIPFLLCQLLKQIGVDIDWLGVSLGIAISIAIGVVLCIALCMAVGIKVGIVVGVAASVLLGVVFGAILGVSRGAISSVLLVVAFGVALGVTYSVTLGVKYSVALGVLHSVVYSVLLGVPVGVASYIVVLGSYIMALGIGIIRPENWLIGSSVNLFSVPNKNCLFPHITFIPLPNLTDRLINWLEEDWEKGLNNLNQLLTYSLQFIPVVSAVNKVLSKTPNQHLIKRVTQLAQNPYDLDLLRFASASLETKLKLEFTKTLIDFPFFFFMSNNWKQGVKNKFVADIRLNTYPRAATAGFWYLYNQQPDKATKAFIVVRDLLYGEEVFILAQTLAIFQEAKAVNTIAKLTIPNFSTENLLRPATWQVMNSLRKVVEDIKLIQHSVSRNTKSFAYSRAIGELTEVIDNKNNIPEAERELIIDIANTWKRSLERIGKDIGFATTMIAYLNKERPKITSSF